MFDLVLKKLKSICLVIIIVLLVSFIFLFLTNQGLVRNSNEEENIEIVINVEENSKLQTLGKEVFSYCVRLKTITLPKSLKEIGPNIFFYCQNLKDIVYLGTKEDWNMMKIETPNDNINEDIISFLQ